MSATVENLMSKGTIADSASPSLRVAGTPEDRAVVTGPESLSDTDLVVLVLGAARRELPALAAALGDGGVAGLARAGIGELAQCKGIGRVRAVRLAASVELGRRAITAASLEATSAMPNKDAVVAWARPRLAALDHEELWVLALDGRQGLRAARRVASGGIHGLHVGVRDILRIVLKEAASAFVLVHNHPSGDPAPSNEDIAFTRSVAEAALVVGTPILDHVIIARQHASSLLELGQIASAT
jgi:DNA repair protein RadC